MRQLGVLLLGAVRHGAQYASLLADEPRVRLLAVADEAGLPAWLDAANAEVAAAQRVPYVRDIDGMLGRDDVHLVVVCSEPTRHARLAASAARAGKHVLVDKPLALTTAEADQVIDAARAGGGQLTFVHRLFSPSIRRLRALIDEGRFGVPWAIHVVWLAAGGLGGGTVEADTLVTDRTLSGGGELANFLGYPVGTIRYLTGLEVQTVYARTAAHSHTAHQRAGVEDFGVLLLGLERGVSATITVGRLADGAARGAGVMRVRVHGSHASAVVDEDRPLVEVSSADGGRVRSAEASGTLALRGLLDDLVVAIERQREPLCGPRDARALAAVLVAAYTSAARGEPVAV